MSLNISFDDSSFFRDMENFVGYSKGFFDGVELGKPKMMKNLSYQIKEILYEYVDSMARIDPQKLSHVYEWYMSGNAGERLYNLDCVSTGRGIAFSYTLSQSKSIQNGSTTPFYDKAMIMESGVPITITPKGNGPLVFQDNGESVFTRKPVQVDHPGGPAAQNGFADTLKEFFSQYISQSLLDVTGIRQQFEDMSDFKNNMPAALTSGYSLGVSVGERWISKIGTIG